MSYDLHGGLHDLSADPAGDRELSLPAVLARLHRARRVRTASRSAVGVAAAGVIALAAVAMGGERGPEPIPPVDTSSPTHGPGWVPTFAPIPLPTPTATPSEAPRVGCGMVVDPADLPYTGYWLSSRTARASSDPNAEFGMYTSVRGEQDAEAVVAARIVDVFAVSSDEGIWSIEGVLATAPDPVVPAPDDISGFPVAAQVRLEACDGGPLTGDTYDLVATVEVTTASGEVVSFISYAEMYVGATPRWVEGDEPDVEEPRTGWATGRTAQAQIAESGLSGCGQAYGDGPWGSEALTIASLGTAQVHDGQVLVSATLQHAGFDVIDGRYLSGVVTVTRGGVVVAQTAEQDFRVLLFRDWTAGSRTPVGGVLREPACGLVDGRLPPGEYQAWLMVTAWVASGTDGTPTFVEGGPWPFTVDGGTPPPTTSPPPTETPTPPSP